MYIVGHCIVAEASGTVPAEDIVGPGIFALMLPDYAHCHAWGYAHCWKPVPPGRDNLDEYLVRAHLLTDWFVHFGDDPSEPRKLGWAYRQMPVFAPLYEPFYSAARRIGVLAPATPPAPLRSFARSMVEYAVDTFLARRGDFDRSFAPVRASLATLGARRGKGSLEWIRAMLAERDLVAPDLSAAVTTLRATCAAAREPEELALHAGLHKLGLTPTEPALDLMRSTVEHGLRRLDRDEIRHLLDHTARFLRTWMPVGPTRR